MKESRNLNGTAVISSSFSTVAIVQILLYVIGTGNAEKALSDLLSASIRDMYFLVAPLCYLLVIFALLFFDSAAKEDYLETEYASDAKGTLVYYLKKYMIGDAIIALVTTIAFVVFHFSGKATPIMGLLYTREALLFGFIFGIFLLFLGRMLAFALAALLWRVLSSDSLPVRIIFAIAKGVMIPLIAIPIAALTSVVFFTAYDLLESIIAFPIAFSETVRSITSELAFIAGLPISYAIVYTNSKNRKMDYLYDTEGYIGVRDGFKYHISAHIAEEIVTAVVVLAISVVLRENSSLRLFNMLGGIALSVLFGAILTVLSQMFAVYESQKRWKTSYFVAIFGDDVRYVTGERPSNLS